LAVLGGGPVLSSSAFQAAPSLYLAL